MRQLSERMSQLGTPMLPSGITNIELGHRRVDVDDLASLADALGVGVAALLDRGQAEDEGRQLVTRAEAIDIARTAAREAIERLYSDTPKCR
ncbi:hypothetical protein IU439_28825 [Nocardia farcinica]|nr:hypothetical protein [Nocardia farcinica]